MGEARRRKLLPPPAAASSAEIAPAPVPLKRRRTPKPRHYAYLPRRVEVEGFTFLVHADGTVYRRHDALGSANNRLERVRDTALIDAARALAK